MLRIKFLKSFSDFNIIPRRIKQDEELEISQRDYERIVNSGGKVQIIGRIIPPPTTETVSDAVIITQTIDAGLENAPKVVKEVTHTDVMAMKGLKKVKHGKA